MLEQHLRGVVFRRKVEDRECKRRVRLAERRFDAQVRERQLKYRRQALENVVESLRGLVNQMNNTYKTDKFSYIRSTGFFYNTGGCEGPSNR